MTGVVPGKAPHWEAPFLAALASSGNVTRSARAAGIDVTGPYNRRQRCPEFRAAWERVIAEREARAAGGIPAAAAPLDGRVSAGSTLLGTNGEGAIPSPGSPMASPSSPLEGEEWVGATSTGAKLGRGARSRWSQAAEARFLEELTASANVNRAAEAAGFSAAAIYKRRVRDAAFARGWDAAISVGRARLEAHLVAAAERTFDADALPVADGAPKVSVGEAISILKHGSTGPPKARPEERNEDYYYGPEEVEKARTDIIARLERVHQRHLANGWSETPEGYMIPPGYGPIGGA